MKSNKRQGTGLRGSGDEVQENEKCHAHHTGVHQDHLDESIYQYQ